MKEGTEEVRGNLSNKYLEMGKKICALEISADYLIQTTPGGMRKSVCGYQLLWL